jgi:hypothetical protein
MPSAFRRAGTKEKVAASASSSSSSSSAAAAEDGAVDGAIPIAGSSSSTRKTSAYYHSSLQGVKPWQGGSYLTSVGLIDLDTILGGGQPLGTAILIEEDRWTKDFALSLVKYWCAEVRISIYLSIDLSIHFLIVCRLSFSNLFDNCDYYYYYYYYYSGCVTESAGSGTYNNTTKPSK